MPAPLTVKEIWPAPSWMTPLKVTSPAAGDQGERWAADLAVGHGAAAAARSDSPSTVWLTPFRSRFAPLAICTGVVLGSAP